MKNLIRLVNTLKTKEIQLLRQMYISYFRETSKEYMGLKLLNSIIKNKIQNNKEATQLICPGKHNSIVSQVKKKLESDILNIMLLSTLIEEKDDEKKQSFACHKNLLLGKMLIDRGLTDEAVTILLNTSQQAEKSELHDVKINCDNILHSVYYGDTYSITRIIHKTNMGNTIEQYSNVLHARFINQPFMYGQSVYQPDTATDYNTGNLMIEMQKSNSRKAVYWYNMGIIHYYIQQNDHKHALSASLDLLNNKNLQNDIASADERNELYLQMARIFIYLNDFHHAIDAAKLCINDMPARLSGITLPFQLLFRCYLRLNEFDMAANAIEKAFSSNQNKNNGYFSVWYLFKAGMLFLDNRYKDACRLLIANEQSFNSNLSQKTYAMLFELINLLETGDFHWFDYKYESFRKRLQRYTLSDADRLYQLYQMISIVKRNNYQYKIDNAVLANSFRKCSNSKWDPLGNEIINLSDWIYNRVGLPLTNSMA